VLEDGEGSGMTRQIRSKPGPDANPLEPVHDIREADWGKGWGSSKDMSGIIVAYMTVRAPDKTLRRWGRLRWVPCARATRVGPSKEECSINR